jgi:MarR family transcriptional regulator, organic hydroperoxide resistance regulator
MDKRAKPGGQMKTQREAGFLISRINRLSRRTLARKMKEYGIDRINPAQGRIMFVLWRNESIPIGELAKKTSLKKSTMTSMLDRLEKSGHVTRVRSGKDRRQILIQRTEKDKNLEKAYVQVSQDMEKLVLKGFSEKEVNELESYLRRLLDNVTAIEEMD